MPRRAVDRARGQKNDDFYTQLTDIERELKYYKKQFKDKIVYCNCDDPKESNFFKYFSRKFRSLGLKKLITTCYKNQNPDIFSLQTNEKSVGIIMEETARGDELPNIEIFNLTGDGDFRSDESIELLKQSDIIVTNPPFSLFREYLAQLIEYDKKFLILGNQNAITYREVYPLIKSNKLWLGMNNGGTKWFQVKPEYEIETESRKKVVNGTKYFSLGNVNWFTNMDHKRRHEPLILFCNYSPEKYPKYDNYDAIEVGMVENIPEDYSGTMGVPITFLSKHNPDQFEIIGFRKGEDGRDLCVNGRSPYFRILIRNRELNDEN